MQCAFLWLVRFKALHHMHFADVIWAPYKLSQEISFQEVKIYFLLGCKELGLMDDSV